MDGETLMGLIIPSAMARAGSVFLHVNKLLSLFAASKPGEASSRKLGAFFNSNAITGSSKPIYSTNPTTTVAMKSQENNENDDVSLSLLYNLSTIQERVHHIQSLVSLSSDVNSVPSRLYCDEEAGASSPNSTISSTISGKRSEREGISGDDHGELTPDRGYSRGTSDEEEDGGETSRKKLRLSKDQSAYLEETFKEHNTLNPKQKLALAKKLNLTARQVEVWFQNRRARSDISPAHYCKMTLLPL